MNCIKTSFYDSGNLIKSFYYFIHFFIWVLDRCNLWDEKTATARSLRLNTPLVEPLRKCSLSQNTYQKVYLAERDASTGLTRLRLSEKTWKFTWYRGY